jgi:hypothetical protein
MLDLESSNIADERGVDARIKSQVSRPVVLFDVVNVRRDIAMFIYEFNDLIGVACNTEMMKPHSHQSKTSSMNLRSSFLDFTSQG